MHYYATTLRADITSWHYDIIITPEDEDITKYYKILFIDDITTLWNIIIPWDADESRCDADVSQHWFQITPLSRHHFLIADWFAVAAW